MDEKDYKAKIDSYTANYRATNSKIDAIIAKENRRPALHWQEPFSFSYIDRHNDLVKVNVLEPENSMFEKPSESLNRFPRRTDGAECINSSFPMK